MSNSPLTPNNQDSESESCSSRFFRWIKQPSTLIGTGVVITIAIGGAIIGYSILRQRLPSIIEAQLEDILSRPVTIGEFEALSLSRIQIGPSEMAATEADADRASIKQIQINYNLSSILTQGKLPVSVLIVEPKIYLDENEDGVWLELDLEPAAEEEEPIELPIDVEATATIRNAEVVLVPQTLNAPVEIFADVEGGLIYPREGEQLVNYNLDATFAESPINIEGQSNLETFQTEAKIAIEQLSLSKLSALVDDLPVTLNQGQVDADLAVNIPSLKAYQESNLEGNVTISNVVGQVAIDEENTIPLSSNLGLQFQQQAVSIAQGEVKIGEIFLSLLGKANLKTGYDLEVLVAPFTIANLLAFVPDVKLPVPTDGEFKVDVNVTGETENPQVDVIFSATKPTQIDRVALTKTLVKINANLEEIRLDRAEIIPETGGIITAEGSITTNLKQALEAGELNSIDLTTKPVELQANVDLPLNDVAAAYGTIPETTRLGSFNSKIQAQGTFKKPNLEATWELIDTFITSIGEVAGEGKATFDGTEFLITDTEIQTDVGEITVLGTGNLETQKWETIVSSNSVAIDPIISELIGQGNLQEAITALNIDIRAGGKLDELTPNGIEGSADVTIALGGRAIDVEGRLEQGNLQALVRGQRLELLPLISPFVPEVTVPVTVRRLQAQLDGKIGDLFTGKTDLATAIAAIRIKTNLTLAVNESPIDVEGNLERGFLQGLVKGQELNLIPFISPYLPEVTVPVTVRQLQAQLTGSIIPFLTGETDLMTALEGLQGQVDTIASINQSDVNINASLAQGGQIAVDLFSNSPIVLTPLLPEIAAQAIFEGGTASVSGTIAQLETFLSTQDLSGLSAQTNLNATLAEGAIAVQGNLENGLWNADVVVSDVNTTELSRPYLSDLSIRKPRGRVSLNFPRFNAELAVSGLINSRLRGDRANVSIDQVKADWGQQSIQASGVAILVNLFTAPDIAETQLNVETNLDFNSLQINKILDLIPIERQYLPQSLDIAGSSTFRGQFTGRELLQSPSAEDSIAITGDLRLKNFKFNDLVFDPVMTGGVNFSTGDAINIILEGENDIILAALDPCLESSCVAPYSLNALEITQQQGEEDAIAIIATGSGNQIDATIENFPLNLFRIAPAEAFGLPGFVGGVVNAEASVNLGTLTANGQLSIGKLGIGETQTEEFGISFEFENNEANVSQGRLIIGANRFNFEGNYNLASGEIGGNLTLKDGKIQDILAVANITSVQDFSPLTGGQNQGNAADLGAIALRPQEETLSSTLALHQQTVTKIQQDALISRQSDLPDQLNLRGDLNIDANVAGTIDNPTLNLAISGQDWEARPRPSIPTVNPILGFVIEDAGILRINDLAIIANYENGVGRLEEASVIIAEGIISVSGEFNQNQEISANAKIENLSLDAILQFVPSPVDATGIIGAEVTVSGTPLIPVVEGNFSLENSSFQGQAIEENFRGEFSYRDTQLTLQTTSPQDIDLQINGAIALPPQAGFENTIAANVEIREGAFNLLAPLSFGQLEWRRGEGNIVATATTSYTDNPEAALDNLDLTGTATFEEAVLFTTALAEEIIVNGQANFTPDRLRIESLQGRVDEADLRVAGVFPYFVPLSESDPDFNKPLTAKLDQGRLNLANLYKGRADANVTFTGMILNPIISGEARLYDGQVLIPQTSGQTLSPAYQRWFGDFAKLQGDPPVNIQLQELRVILDEGFRFSSPPVYDFSMTGDFTLTGSPLNIPSLRSSGTITLNRGEITLFNTDFFLSRLNENRVVFDPSRPIVNPNLDVEMGTTITDPSNAGQASEANEVRDDVTRVGRPDTITVDLAVKGQAQDILASLGAIAEEDACAVTPEDFFPQDRSNRISDSHLNQEEQCLSQNVVSGNESSQQILESSAVQLTSSPSRTRGEIVELLAQQFIGLAEQLENSTGQELLQFGATEFLIEPLARDIIFFANEQATKLAQPMIGVDRAEIYPQVQGIYLLGENSFVGVGYDYVFSEFRVRYQRSF